MLRKNRRELDELFADLCAGYHFALLVGVALFKQAYEAEEFAFERVDEKTGARTHNGIGRHQLRMRESFIDILIDDCGLIQRQIAFHQDGQFAVGIELGDLGGRVARINVNHFKVAAFFMKNETAAVRKGAGGTRVQNHHKYLNTKRTKRGKLSLAEEPSFSEIKEG